MNTKGHVAVFAMLLFVLGVASAYAYNGLGSPSLEHLQPSPYYKGTVQAGELTNPIQVDYGVTIQSKDRQPLLLTGVTPTGSMRPSISDDSVVIIAAVPKEKVQVGDIVLIERPDDTRLLHRVIKIENDIFFTKGDNNKDADSTPWDFSQIKGKVVGVLY